MLQLDKQVSLDKKELTRYNIPSVNKSPIIDGQKHINKVQRVLRRIKMKNTINVNKILNTGLGVVALLGLMACPPTEPTDRGSEGIPATNILINNGAELVVTNNGGSDTLTAAVLPTNHTEGDVVWTSSSDEIVSVSKDNATTATFTAEAVGSATITARVGANNVMDTITIMVDDNRVVIDSNGNGLIDILNLTMLHNMRYNLAGTSYKTNSSDVGNSRGCPSEECNGYELVGDLSFDTDGDGTWSGSAGNYTLDSDDNNAVYFNVSEGGWEPIGDDSDPFAAIFEGNDFTITGLATSSSNGDYFGMFGYTSGAHISNLGLVNNLADYRGNSGNNEDNIYVGGLVGRQDGGSIVASYATGAADGGYKSADSVGGLVGRQDGGSIVASYATGNVNGGNERNDRVGGLVGWQSGGSIVASYATGNVNGGGGTGSDVVGGLVGWQDDGSIVASYATGAANAGAIISFQRTGGLVGEQDAGGIITASYATGNVNGGGGASIVDVGGLVGRQFSGGIITASYATGNVSGGGNGDAGALVGDQRSSPADNSYGFGSGGDPDGDPPVSSAVLLTLSNAGSVWNDASSGTAGAWQFGGGAPKLFFNDYDGSGSMFGCEGSSATIILPNCGSLISGPNTNNILATSIVIESSVTTITNNTPDTNITFTAQILPANHTEGDLELTWASSDGRLVQVSTTSDTATYNAVFTDASANDPVTISAWVDGYAYLSNNIQITLYHLAATNIVIAHQGIGLTNLSLSLADGSGTLTAQVTPAEHTSGAITWENSDNNVSDANPQWL